MDACCSHSASTSAGGHRQPDTHSSRPTPMPFDGREAAGVGGRGAERTGGLGTARLASPPIMHPTAHLVLSPTLYETRYEMTMRARGACLSSPPLAGTRVSTLNSPAPITCARWAPKDGSGRKTAAGGSVEPLYSFTLVLTCLHQRGRQLPAWLGARGWQAQLLQCQAATHARKPTAMRPHVKTVGSLQHALPGGGAE